MLLILKEDNTTGSLYLCCLLCVLTWLLCLIKMYKCAFICNYSVCRWCGRSCVSVFTVSCGICNMLVAACASAVVCIYVNIAELHIIYCYWLCPIKPTHPPAYNIAKCCIYVIICHLSDDELSLLYRIVINVFLHISMWGAVLLLVLAHDFICVLTSWMMCWGKYVCVINVIVSQ